MAETIEGKYERVCVCASTPGAGASSNARRPARKSLGLSRFARAILLNLFERSRGPRDWTLDMWKVRRWRA